MNRDGQRIEAVADRHGDLPVPGVVSHRAIGETDAFGIDGLVNLGAGADDLRTGRVGRPVRAEPGR